MKKIICLIITIIMCTTTFIGVISSADNEQQNVQSNLQKSHSKPYSSVSNWSLITNCETAENALKDQPEILNKCTPEFFLDYKIYVLSFSVNSAAAVTYSEPFKYNVSYPEYLCKCLTTYTDYLIVDKDVEFNGVILLNETYSSSGKSVTKCLYPKQIYIFTPEQEPVIKKVTKIKVKSPKKKTVKVTWKKLSNVTGYEIAISTNKNFKSNKTTEYRVKHNQSKIKIKKLKKKKQYYIKIRAYKTLILNGQETTVYSKKWSAVKTIKTK